MSDDTPTLHLTTDPETKDAEAAMRIARTPRQRQAASELLRQAAMNRVVNAKILASEPVEPVESAEANENEVEVQSSTDKDIASAENAMRIYGRNTKAFSAASADMSQAVIAKGLAAGATEAAETPHGPRGFGDRHWAGAAEPIGATGATETPHGPKGFGDRHWAETTGATEANENEVGVQSSMWSQDQIEGGEGGEGGEDDNMRFQAVREYVTKMDGDNSQLDYDYAEIKDELQRLRSSGQIEESEVEDLLQDLENVYQGMQQFAAEVEASPDKAVVPPALELGVQRRMWSQSQTEDDESGLPMHFAPPKCRRRLRLPDSNSGNGGLLFAPGNKARLDSVVQKSLQGKPRLWKKGVGIPGQAPQFRVKL